LKNEKKKSYKRTQIEKTIKRMGIKIKIKNKLDGNYKLLTRGLNRKEK
jgi:2-hydroxychromene-2-carboxylate isomerase